MAYQTIEFPDAITVAYLLTTEFPAGIAPLWETLMKTPLPLRGRRCFGIMPAEQGAYHAAFEIRDGDDINGTELLRGIVPAGKYAGRLIEHWPTVNLSVAIPTAFNELGKECTRDASRPCLEWYDEQDALWVLVPVA